MGTLPTNAVNPFRVCAASAWRPINPFASPGASSIVDVSHASCSTNSRPNSANAPTRLRQGRAHQGCRPRLPPVIISLGGGRRSRRAPPARPTIYACAATAPKSPRSSSPARACLRRLRKIPLARWLDGLPTAAVLDQKVMKDIGKQGDAHGARQAVAARAGPACHCFGGRWDGRPPHRLRPARRAPPEPRLFVPCARRGLCRRDNFDDWWFAEEVDMNGFG
ncbi:hypothetical protein C8J57DRAFT_766455 [Mycena rebaudengoi]|nr:hypothetical protein C8J57DRAFT_766455 [Mycena rebaudengoi]